MLPVVALSLAACSPPVPCGAPDPVPDALPAQPNVLIVLLDDVGVDQIGRYALGAPTAPTPTIDCLCDRGLRFERVWASALCSPGRAQLATGRLSVRTGIGHNVEPGEQLPLDEVTLGEVAREAGYTTGWVGKWHLGGHTSPSGADGPNLQGFDHFAGSLANLAIGRDDLAHAFDYDRWLKVTDGEARVVDAYPTTETTDDALAFVQAAAGPWLLVVAYNAPHGPAHVPPGRLVAGGRPADRPDALYQAMLEATDHELGRLLQDMDPATLANTVVVVTSDNGTPDEAVLPPVHPAQHKGTLLEGGVRVPMVISGPGIARGTTGALAHGVDLLPTVAELVGAPLPDVPLDGLSLVPVLRDPDASAHDVLVNAMFPLGGEVRWAARSDGYKLFRDPGGEALYRLARGAGFDDGPDLLLDGASDEELAARDLLAVAIDSVDEPRMDDF